MPISLDPNRTFSITLAGDESAPEHMRPALVFRYPTARQYRALSEAIAAVSKATTDIDAIGGMCDAIRLALVGWRNFPVEYDPSQLDAVLSVGDLQELCYRIREEATAQEIDLKKSASLSKSNAGDCAATAPPATAETSPTPTVAS